MEVNANLEDVAEPDRISEYADENGKNIQQWVASAPVSQSEQPKGVCPTPPSRT